MRKAIQTICVLIICTICFQTQAQTPATKNETSITNQSGVKVFLDKTQTSMDKFELEMLAEVNAARLTPGVYAGYIQKYIDDGKGMGDDKKVAIGLIQDLNNLQKQIDQKKITMNKIEALDCVFLAARDHAINQAPTGDLNHVDTNGKNPWDRIYKGCTSKVPEYVEYPLASGATGMSPSRGSNENLEMHSSYKKDNPDARAANINLLLDSGIKGYGHRTNVIDPNWKYGGFYYYYEDHTSTAGYYKVRWIQKYARDKADSKDASNNPMVALPIQDPDSKTRTTYPEAAWTKQQNGDILNGDIIDASAGLSSMNATEAAAAPKHEGTTASTSGSSTPTNNTGNTSGSSTPTSDSGNTSGTSTPTNTSGSTTPTNTSGTTTNTSSENCVNKYTTKPANCSEGNGILGLKAGKYTIDGKEVSKECYCYWNNLMFKDCSDGCD